MKITKTRIRKELPLSPGDIPSGFVIDRMGAFIYNEEVYLFVTYEGQGVNEIEFNRRFDGIVYFDDVVKDIYSYSSIKVRVDVIYSRIVDMIDEYFYKYKGGRYHVY